MKRAREWAVGSFQFASNYRSIAEQATVLLSWITGGFVSGEFRCRSSRRLGGRFEFRAVAFRRDQSCETRPSGLSCCFSFVLFHSLFVRPAGSRSIARFNIRATSSLISFSKVGKSFLQRRLTLRVKASRYVFNAKTRGSLSFGDISARIRFIFDVRVRRSERPIVNSCNLRPLPTFIRVIYRPASLRRSKSDAFRRQDTLINRTFSPINDSSI